jgi:hypothetical protein
MQIPANSVWSSMNYTPPRGSCNHKNGMISNKCPCLRFMLHPVKVGHLSHCSSQSLSGSSTFCFPFMPTHVSQAATSFECDGCGHHASYHNLDNPSEDAILAKWSAQEKTVSAQQQPTTSSRNKRKRITAQSHDAHQSPITIADEAPEVTAAGTFDTSNTVHAFSSLFSNRNGNQR